MGRLLDALAPFAERLSPDLDDTSLIGVARRDFEKALNVRPDHVARASALGSAAYDAWTRARPANDFATMLPFLEKAVDLSRVRPTTPPPGEFPFVSPADETVGLWARRREFASKLVWVVTFFEPIPR